MPTKEPVPPPKSSVLSTAGAESVQEAVLRWRKMERVKHPGAEFELAELRNVVDALLNRIESPPTSAPPRQLSKEVKSIVEDVKSLERSKNELDTIRATLIVNFGPTGEPGQQCGVTIPDASEKSNVALLVAVLEGLFEKAVKSEKGKG